MQAAEDEKTCVKCWEDSVDATQLLPCRHFVCFSCYEEAVKLQTDSDILSQHSVVKVKCSGCGEHGQISDDAFRRLKSSKFACDGACWHDTNLKARCKHCDCFICPKLAKLHKESIRSEALSMAEELSSLLSDTDGGAVAKSQEETLLELSRHLKQQMTQIVTALYQKLLVVYDKAIEERRASFDEQVAGGDRSKCGDFQNAESLAADLKNPTVYAAMITEDVVASFQTIKERLDLVKSFGNEKVAALNMNEVVAMDNERLSAKLDEVAADFASVLLPLKQSLKKVDPVPEVKKADDPKKCQVLASGNKQTTSSKGNISCRETPVPPAFAEKNYFSLEVAEVFADVRRNKRPPGLLCVKPARVAFFRELGNDRFVVVHATRRISIFDFQSFAPLKCFKFTPPLKGDRSLSGDIVLFDNYFYFSNQDRTHIFRVSCDLEQSKEQSEIFLDMSSKMRGERIWGFDVCRSTKEIILITGCYVLAVRIDRPSVTRNITPNWQVQDHLYLRAVSEDETSVILSHIHGVYRCPLLVCDGGIRLGKDLDCIMYSKASGVRGCAIDPLGNIVIAEKNNGLIKICKPDGKLLHSFVPNEKELPNFEPTELTLVPNQQSPVILTSEFHADRLAILSALK